MSETDGEETYGYQNRSFTSTEVPLERYYSIENMIEKTGGFGRLQLGILVCMLIANMPSAFYAHGLPVLEQFPDYTGSTMSGYKYRCSRNEIGLHGEPRDDISWEIDWDSDKSIKNWIHEMNLMGLDKYKIGLFGAIYFIGVALSGIFLKFSDHYGRKIMIQFGCLTSGFVVFYLYVFEDIYSRYTLLFGLGVLSFRLVALYILIMELSPKPYQIYVSAGYAIIDHYIAVILPSVYFRFIGKEYKVIFILAVVAAPISFMLSLLLPESPQYYYEKLRYDMNIITERERSIEKLKVTFSQIAKFNGKQIPTHYQFVFENGYMIDDENSNRRFIWQMLKDKSILINLIVAVLMFSAISFNTNLLNFHSKYFSTNGYDMAFLMMHADIVGTIIAVLLRSYHLSTKSLLIISFGVSAIFTMPLVYIPEVDWITMVSVVGCQFGISISYYLSILTVSENFPPLFVAFAFFMGNFTASLINIISPLIAEAAHPTPMKLLFSVSGAMGMLGLISHNIRLFSTPILKRSSEFDDDETLMSRSRKTK